MSGSGIQKGERQPFAEVDRNSNLYSLESSPTKRITGKATPASSPPGMSYPSIEFPTSPSNDALNRDEVARIPLIKSPSRQSSVGSSGSNIPMASSTSSLQGYTPAPTLGSALGINTSTSVASSSSSTALYGGVVRKGSRSSGKQSSHSNSIPPPVWARRPSLPTMPSMGNRMSVASISSFDSLPENETVPRFSASPLGRSSQSFQNIGEGNEGIRSGSSPASTSSYVEVSARAPLIDLKKRKNLAMELLSTEHLFVASLRLINDHYYQPLSALSKGIASSKLESLSTAAPILSRKAVSEIFSNFYDILHLNLELLNRLDDRLSGRSRKTPTSRPTSMATTSASSDLAETEDTSKPWDAENDSIGDLLVPMAPFLKMYSLYVKNFSAALTRIESERKSNESFARFLRETEKASWARASNSGGFGYGLGLQAHLLTIVQRIPRYKLLVGDLVQCTPTNHKDYADLCKAYAVIEKVAGSINDDIRQQEVVVAMLGLQRSFVGLSEPLVIPGRSLLKRGTLLKACRKNIQSREFFLFTDCLVYAAPISGSIDAASAAWQALSRYGSTEALVTSPIAGPTSPKSPERPPYISESRSYSSDNIRIRTRTMSGPSPYESRRNQISSEAQQLQFRGKFSLQDCTVVAVDDVVSPEPWLRHCLEIRTPGKSFAVYADTYEVKLEWLSAIRSAREEWVSNRRTLHAEEDSIQAKRDRRRSLQVGAVSQRSLASARKSSMVVESPSTTSIPENEGIEIKPSLLPRASSSRSLSLNKADFSQSEMASTTSYKSKPLKVLEEYNAPVWVPDSRADRCACCNEQFGIWRRKHHCRLCGQVVCWACSSKTFLIASYEEGEEDRPARACDVCYESVFPESPEPSTLWTTRSKEVEDRRPSMGRPDSEVSLNAPSTPTSPPFNQDNVQFTDCNDGGASNLDIDEGMSALSLTASPPFSRRSSNKNIVKFPRAKGTAEVLLFPQGNLLSAQIQAATSGSGTFRLVTPRLTTPEHEQTNAATTNSSSTNASSDGVDSTGHQVLGDYFSGVQHGQTELDDHPIPRLKRKKPLSAAARLSSVYGGLISPSMTNLTKS